MAKKKKKEEDNERRLVTPEYVRNMFSVSQTTLHNWRDRGVLVPVMIGPMVRYKECEVNQLYDSL